jgi:hypothetical protein
MCVLIVAVFLAAVGLAIFGPIIFSLLKHLRPLKRLRDSRAVRASADRHRVRVAFASIWTNALGLGLIAAVIFLVGASHLGFEIWRHYSGESTPLSTAKLEELLQKKLPDPETQQRQHQELVDAIKSRRPRDEGPPPVDNNEAIQTVLSNLTARIENLENAAKDIFDSLRILEIVAWGGIAFGVILGLGLAIRGFFSKEDSKKRKTAEALGGIALVIASALGGIKIKADFKGEFPLFKGVTFGPGGQKPISSPTPAPRDVDVYLHLDVGRGQDAPPVLMDCRDAGGRVGPFAIGATTLEAQNEGDPETIARKLKDRTARHSSRLTAIMLIGSADKRSLRPRTASLYSSNAGLAQARIGVVRKALENVFKPGEPPPILEFYAGPTQTDAKSPPDRLSGDRTVKVCVLWDRKPESN